MVMALRTGVKLGHTLRTRTPIFQELFSGTARLTTAMEEMTTIHTLKPVEVYEDPFKKTGYKKECDLSRPMTQQRIRREVRTGAPGIATDWFLGTPCDSFCPWHAVNGGTRTMARPEGTGLGPRAASEKLGNNFGNFSAGLGFDALGSK